MAKLKIGTVTTQRKQVKKKIDEPSYSDLSDEQLSEMSELVDDMEKDDSGENAEETGVKIDGIPVKVDNIKSIEDFNFDEVLIKEFKETYPNKKIIYRNQITNQFVDFYLDMSHSGGQLTDVHYNLLTDKQKAKFISEIDIISAVDEVNNGLIESEEQIYDGYIISGKNITIDPTEEQSKIYEFILSEKWESREKGIVELDDIIREAIRNSKKKPKSLTRVLDYLIEKFSLSFKANASFIKPKEKKFITGKELSKAIIYFGHIKFLWTLLDDDTLFELKRTFTDEESEHIEKIRILKEGHIA